MKAYSSRKSAEKTNSQLGCLLLLTSCMVITACGSSGSGTDPQVAIDPEINLSESTIEVEYRDFLSTCATPKQVADINIVSNTIGLLDDGESTFIIDFSFTNDSEYYQVDRNTGSVTTIEETPSLRIYRDAGEPIQVGDEFYYVESDLAFLGDHGLDDVPYASLIRYDKAQQTLTAIEDPAGIDLNILTLAGDENALYFVANYFNRPDEITSDTPRLNETGLWRYDISSGEHKLYSFDENFEVSFSDMHLIGSSLILEASTRTSENKLYALNTIDETLSLISLDDRLYNYIQMSTNHNQKLYFLGYSDASTLDSQLQEYDPESGQLTNLTPTSNLSPRLSQLKVRGNAIYWIAYDANARPSLNDESTDARLVRYDLTTQIVTLYDFGRRVLSNATSFEVVDNNVVIMVRPDLSPIDGSMVDNRNLFVLDTNSGDAQSFEINAKLPTSFNALNVYDNSVLFSAQSPVDLGEGFLINASDLWGMNFSSPCL